MSDGFVAPAVGTQFASKDGGAAGHYPKGLVSGLNNLNVLVDAPVDAITGLSVNVKGAVLPTNAATETTLGSVKADLDALSASIGSTVDASSLNTVIGRLKSILGDLDTLTTKDFATQTTLASVLTALGVTPKRPVPTTVFQQSSVGNVLVIPGVAGQLTRLTHFAISFTGSFSTYVTFNIYDGPTSGTGKYRIAIPPNAGYVADFPLAPLGFTVANDISISVPAVTGVNSIITASYYRE